MARKEDGIWVVEVNKDGGFIVMIKDAMEVGNLEQRACEV